jgi:hypothetical protein
MILGGLSAAIYFYGFAGVDVANQGQMMEREVRIISSLGVAAAGAVLFYLGRAKKGSGA